MKRAHEELFHELRAVIPGAQVLFAFLLSVAFMNRFEQLDDVQRSVYYATFVLAAMAIILLMAPSSFHRLRFWQHDKEALLRIANVETIVALVVLSLAVAGAVFLITDVLWNRIAATVAAGLLWLGTAIVWWGIPLARPRRHGSAR